MTISIVSEASLTLDLPPSCVEFWPCNPRWAVAGTYYLERNEAQDHGDVEVETEEVEITERAQQQRSGSLVLLDVSDDKISIAQTLPTPSAIFDLHFPPASHGTPNRIGAVTSTGSFSLFAISETSPDPDTTSSSNVALAQITSTATHQIFPKTDLITYFAWHPTITNLVGVTLASGEVKLCRLPSSGEALDTTWASSNAPTLLTHTLEAWFIAFSLAGDAVFSGGDDSTLRHSTLPPVPELANVAAPHEKENSEETSSLSALIEESEGDAIQFADLRTHSAGVTAILPLSERLVLTGSYDDHIRLLEYPEYGGSVRRPRVLLEENLEGGVWRLKVMQTSSPTPDAESNSQGDGNNLEIQRWRILASCMHAGTRVLDIAKTGDDEWKLDVVGKFEEHKSMNYGSDFRELRDEKDRRWTVLSTSFYDRLVCVWRV